MNDVDPLTSHNRLFTFNGDNKQIAVKDTNTNITKGQYFYDGEGKRVKKVNPETGETTIFVYSSGKLVAEYATATPPANPSINYTTTDHLGSPRIITDAIGQVKSRRDFLPFGEEVTPNVGNRTASPGYSATDNIRQKFTGYQKDTETSLDFAEARMYENRFGRFTAVDPLLASGKSDNPQTFNRYAYTSNNPVVRVDANGKDWYYVRELNVDRYGRSFYHTRVFWLMDGVNIFGYDRYTGPGIIYETAGKYRGYYTALDPYEGRQRSFNTRAAAVAHYNSYLRDRNVNASRGFADAVAGMVTGNPLTALLYDWGADAVIGRPNPSSNVYTVTNRTTNAMIIVVSGISGAAGGTRIAGGINTPENVATQGFPSFGAFKRVFGSAGEGRAWHHVVEQTPGNIAKFGNEAVHNTGNIVNLPSGSGSVHSRISAYYSSKQDFTNGLTVRQWLSERSFQEQYEFGLEVLKRFSGEQ